MTFRLVRIEFLLLTLIACCCAASSNVLAQTAAAPPAQQQTEQQSAPPAERFGRSGEIKKRVDLLRLLNLTPEQRAQIRAVREENEAAKREAYRRRDRAQRALDQAVYADNFDEAAVEARARELAAAHSEVFLLRTKVELRIRRLLTAEQLTRFREFRRQRRFSERGENEEASPKRRRPADAPSQIAPSPSP